MMPDYSAGWNLLWTVPMTAVLVGAVILLALCGIGFAIGRPQGPTAVSRSN